MVLYINNHIRRVLVFSVLLIIFLPNIAAQDTTTRSKYFITGARLHYGYIFAHTKTIQAAAHSNPLGLQADFSFHYTSKEAYNYCNCYPRLGFSLYLWDFMNSEILGQAVNLLAFAEPFFRPEKRLSFSIRAGMGIAYLNKPYDEETNPENLCYSTQFAFALLINLSIYYKITDRLQLNLVGNYNHISNGGIKLPNKGLNYPSISLGIDYSFDKLYFSPREKIHRSNFHKKNFILASVFLGFKGITEDEKLYFITGLLGKFGRQISQMSAFNGGIEFNIDGAEKKLASIYPEIPSNAPYKLSLTGGYEYLLGRFSLTFDLGIYLYNVNRRTDLVYQRYGVNIKIKEKVNLGVNIKAHRHVADFFDIRIGYIF